MIDEGDNFTKPKKRFIRVKMLSKLDALIETRNQLLLQQVTHEFNKYVYECDYLESKQEGTLLEGEAVKIEEIIRGAGVQAKSFARSVERIEDLIQRELNQERRPKN